MPLSLAKLHLRYQGHIATRQKQRHDERCSWVEPWDRIAWHSILSEIAQDDSLEKQRSGRMMALHCRSRAGPVRSSLGKRVPQTRNWGYPCYTSDSSRMNRQKVVLHRARAAA